MMGRILANPHTPLLQMEVIFPSTEDSQDMGDEAEEQSLDVHGSTFKCSIPGRSWPPAPRCVGSHHPWDTILVLKEPIPPMQRRTCTSHSSAMPVRKVKGHNK